MQSFETEFGEKKLKIEIGELAQKANGSVLASLGETVVLATCTLDKKVKEGVNFFPLTVDYEERLYAAGIIKKSRFLKREGRPTDEATLHSRMIDRAIRPRFNQQIRNEIQVVITVLSMDDENSAEILGLIATSCALMISDIPWDGPIGAVKIGKRGNEITINPSYRLKEETDFLLTVAGTETKINMIEVNAKQSPEDDILKATEIAQKEIKKIVDFQKSIVRQINPTKTELPINQVTPEVESFVKNYLIDKLEAAVYAQTKGELSGLPNLEHNLQEKIKSAIEKGEIKLEEIKAIDQAINIFESEIDKLIHKNILESERRPDGRKLDEVRPISCKAGIFPRVHGSALFNRGATQALAVVTLGGPAEEQILESIEFIEEKKHFILHYNFPPYCTGETKRLGSPGRREIGHGALTEKAIASLVPNKDQFPYTIRVVSEILSSNGSSSMASVCVASMALMDAGVPIKEAAAGIAMGLIVDKKGKQYKILTDIQGPEDHHGDMDLKVAGTRKGLTALQMDVKIEGIDEKILKDVLIQAKQARLYILKEMEKVISAPRKELSSYAPRIITLQINPEKIRDVIGPGGKIINTIISETGVEIDIEDSGLIFITSKNKEASEKAIEWIKNLTHEVKPGEIFQGKVTRILNFGAFVEILPGQEGLVHISEIAPYRIARVEDAVKVGSIVPVKVKNIDEHGRINLSIKDALK